MFGIHLHLNLFIIIINLLFSAHSEIPSTVLCADPRCSDVISEAQAKISYTPSEENVLGFKKGTKIFIISKSKEKDGYWGARIGNRVGFVPSAYVKEVSVWKGMDSLKYEFSTNSQPIPSVTKGNEILKQDVNMGPENPISGTPHGSSITPQSDNNNESIYNMSLELNNETQNPQLASSYKEPALQTSNIVSSSSKVDAVVEIPNTMSREINANEKPETGGNSAIESVGQTILQGNSAEMEDGNVNSETIVTGGEKMPGEQVDHQTAERTADHEDANLNEEIIAEAEIVTYQLNVNNIQDSDEKNQGENTNINTDTIKSVDVNEEENNHSDNLSNNFKSSESDHKDSAKSNLENDAAENLENLHKISLDIARKTQADTTEVPFIVEDGDLSGEVNTLKSENKPSVNNEHAADNGQNILPNHIEGINAQAELKSDTGTVKEVNETSVKLEEYVDLSETLVQDNSANVHAVVSGVINSDYSSSSGSSSSSSRSSSSNSSSSSSRSSSSSSSSSTRSNIVSDGPTADGSENGTQIKLVNDAGMPLHQFQKDRNIPSEAQGDNAKRAHVEHISQQETSESDFNSAGNPDPSSVHISLGHIPPYNFVRQREKSYTETTPPTINEVSNGESMPPSMVINGDKHLSPQFVPPTGEPINVKNFEDSGSLESANNDKDISPQEHYTDVKQPGKNYDEIPSTQLPAQENMQSDDFEKIFAGTTEPPGPRNTDGSVPENLQYEVPTAQMASGAFQATESILENSNTEFSTSVPPSDTVTSAYGNTEEKQTPDKETGEVTSETIGGGGFFSNVRETMLGWVGLGSEKEKPEPEIQQGNRFEETLLVESQTSDFYTNEETMTSDETCQAADGTTINCNAASDDDSNSLWSFWLDNKSMTPTSSYNTLICLVVTAVTVLLFTLGYYFIEKFRSDGPLIAKVNRLEQELLVSSKECLILKDELTNTKEKLNLFETSSNDKIITSLQQELEEAKKIRGELENNIEVLQQELDAATEAGLDLNRMLSEVLTQKGGSETLMESVEHLQAQLNNQQKIIDEMTSKLFTKTNENQELQDELTAASEKIESLEGEIEDMRGNLNVHLKENEDVIKDLTSKNNELQLRMNQINEAKEKDIAKLKKNVSEFENKLKATSDSLKIKEEECNNLKDSIKKIKVKDGRSIDSLFEASRVKAELNQATSENSSLKDRLREEEDKFAELDSKVKKLEEEIQKSKQISSEAEKEKREAQTRLEVLSNYFKEKETQLQKELGLREAMWVQKQGDDSTIYEKMKSLEEEINNYKSQNEALKKEILDQERGLKAQITTLEKKAHENWIAARQAERKLEETKQEAAQLRNKMTLMEKNISNDLESSQHHRVNDELNGGDALSPLIHDTSSPILFPPPLPLDPNNSSLMPPGFIPPPMFMPPPPGGFMPPPPPFLPGDHRPPPLGRMSSPPLNNRFSPPPPDYAYDRMSTPPLSPSNRNYRSPNESDRDRERFRHRTPTSPSFRSRNWEEGSSVGISGFRPINSERDSRRDHKGGSNLSSGHSSDSLDKSSRHSSRV